MLLSHPFKISIFLHLNRLSIIWGETMYSWDYAHLRTAPTGYEPLEHAPTRAAVRAVYSLVVFTPTVASAPTASAA